jgi:hypothetical protein
VTDDPLSQTIAVLTGLRAEAVRLGAPIAAARAGFEHLQEGLVSVFGWHYRDSMQLQNGVRHAIRRSDLLMANLDKIVAALDELTGKIQSIREG